jgi:hypothetical protein
MLRLTIGDRRDEFLWEAVHTRTPSALLSDATTLT